MEPAIRAARLPIAAMTFFSLHASYQHVRSLSTDFMLITRHVHEATLVSLQTQNGTGNTATFRSSCFASASAFTDPIAQALFSRNGIENLTKTHLIALERKPAAMSVPSSSKVKRSSSCWVSLSKSRPSNGRFARAPPPIRSRHDRTQQTLINDRRLRMSCWWSSFWYSQHDRSTFET